MYKLTVITPEKIVFDETVFSLIANGGKGYLQVLSNHCSLLSTIQPGKLTIERENHEKLIYALSGGFLEVSHNIATILADAIETPEEIDLARAESAAKRAKERLKSPEAQIDIPRVKAALKRAENRIKIYNEYNASHSSHVKIQL